MAKRNTNQSSKQKRGESRRRAAQRPRLFWGIGIVATLIGIVYFTFSGRSQQATANLSEAEVADLPVGPQIGARAPDFSLNTSRGSKTSLSDFRGKPIAIMFFHSW